MNKGYSGVIHSIGLLLALIVSALCPVGLVVAQGTVVFNNDTGLVILTTPQGSSLMPVGAGFVQLAYAPTGGPYVPWNGQSGAIGWLAANPAWTFATPPVGFTSEPGKFDGGVVTLQGVAH